MSTAVRMLARMGIPMPPPMLVNPVTKASRPGLRNCSMNASVGLSRFARPASSTTLS